MFTFLLVLHALVAASLVGVILMQRSEGGGLGMGGSPSGLMSARGAADFLTRATTILATIFVVMSIGLAAYAGVQRAQRPIDTSLARPGGIAGGPIPGAAPAGGVPLADPLAAGAAAAGNATPPPVPGTATVAPRAETPSAKPAKVRTVERTAPASSADTRPASSATPAPSAPAPTSTTAPKPSPTPTPKADSTPASFPPAAGNSTVPLAQ